MVIAVIGSVLAGLSFAAAGILQQHAASSRPPSESLSWRLLLNLAKDRTWVAGISLAVLSYGFQSLALAFGPLSVVQVIMVCELVFAVPISARVHHVHVGLRTILAVALVAGGLAAAVLAASPSEGDPSGSGWGWLVVVSAAGALAFVAVMVGRQVAGVARASLFALGAAVIMGTQSALLNLTIVNLQKGPAELFGAWQTYLLIVASIVGLLLIQSAYQEGPLAASLPVFDATEPTVAVVIGVTFFGEHLASGLWREIIASVAAVVVIAGIFLLDTAPAIKRLHRAEQEEQEEQEQPTP